MIYLYKYWLYKRLIRENMSCIHLIKSQYLFYYILDMRKIWKKHNLCVMSFERYSPFMKYRKILTCHATGFNQCKSKLPTNLNQVYIIMPVIWSKKIQVLVKLHLDISWHHSTSQPLLLSILLEKWCDASNPSWIEALTAIKRNTPKGLGENIKNTRERGALNVDVGKRRP